MTQSPDDPTAAAAPIRRIVVAVDLNRHTTFLLQNAVSLAQALGAHLEVVHAVAPSAFASPAPGPLGATTAPAVASHQSVLGWCQQSLQQAVDATLDDADWIDVTVLEGVPSEVIPEHAEKVGADLLMVASGGNRGFKRLLLGSTAESMMRESSLPTLVLTKPTAGGASFSTDAQ